MGLGIGFWIAFFLVALTVRLVRIRSLQAEVEGLPNDLRDLIGPAPDFLPPPVDRLPEALNEFHKKRRDLYLISRIIWQALFAITALGLLFSILKATS